MAKQIWCEFGVRSLQSFANFCQLVVWPTLGLITSFVYQILWLIIITKKKYTRVIKRSWMRVIWFTTLFKISCSFLVTSSGKKRVCLYWLRSLKILVGGEILTWVIGKLRWWKRESKRKRCFFYFSPAEDSRNWGRIDFTLSIRKRLSIKKWARKIAPGKKNGKELSPELSSEVNKLFLGM